MAQTCNCCGCSLVDGVTSIASGSGSSGDPYEVDIIDPMFYSQRYAIRRQRSTNQTITNDTLTEIDFTTAAAGSFNRGWTFTSPSSFVVPVSGIYIYGVDVAFADNANGTRYVEILKNDSVVLTSCESNSNAGSTHFVASNSSGPLNGGDILKARVRQVSTVSLDIVVNAEQSPVFWAVYIGRFV